jgi:hypothetical protein
MGVFLSSADVQRKLAALNADYQAVTSRKPAHFFCPILYRNEQVELCKPHIISSSIRDSDRTWTIQRADVDNRFGSIFESDFEILQYRGQGELTELFTDPKLLDKLRPKFRVEDREVDYFVAHGPVPSK